VDLPITTPVATAQVGAGNPGVGKTRLPTGVPMPHLAYGPRLSLTARQCEISKPPTPAMTEEEMAEKQKRIQENKVRLRKETESRNKELERIHRNIDMDWARRKQNSQLLPSSSNATQSALAKAGTSRAPTPTQTRLKLRLLGVDGKTLVKTFPVETKLSEVADMVSQELDVAVASFTQPDTQSKVWREAEFSLTLQQAKLVPSAALIVKQKVVAETPDGLAGSVGAVGS